MRTGSDGPPPNGRNAKNVRRPVRRKTIGEDWPSGIFPAGVYIDPCAARAKTGDVLRGSCERG